METVLLRSQLIAVTKSLSVPRDLSNSNDTLSELVTGDFRQGGIARLVPGAARLRSSISDPRPVASSSRKSFHPTRSLLKVSNTHQV
jgi:hypothetical protein